MINLWVTERCNLKCEYCYVENSKGKKDIDKSLITPICDFAVHQQKGRIIVNFFGGEPLIAFDKIKMIVSEFEKRQTETRYLITTNATLVTKEIAEYLKNKDFSVSVSMDGRENTHDKCRVYCNGKGSFNDACKGLEILMDTEIKEVRIRGTYNSDTVYELDENIEFLLEKYRCDIVFAPDLFDENWNDDKLQFLSKVYEKYKSNEKVSIYDEIDNPSFCGGGINDFHINVYGEVFPCSFVMNDKRFIIGNVFDGLNVKKIEELQEVNRKRIFQCKGCVKESTCRSFKCKYLNIKLMGDALIPSPVVCSFENMCQKM